MERFSPVDVDFAALYGRDMPKPPKISENPLTEAAKQLGIPAWGKILIWAFILSLAVLVPGAIVEFVHIEAGLASFHTALNDLPERIGSEEDAKLERLRADLIKEFFSRAQSFSQNGKPADAVAAIRAAIIITNIATKDRAPADSAFFQSVFGALKTISSGTIGPSVLMKPTHDAGVALADYRSALQSVPNLPLVRVIKGQVDWHQIAKDLGYASALECAGRCLQAPLSYQFPKGSTVTGLVLVGGTIILDNLTWDHVMFANMHIIYNGSPMILRALTFVNCTFTIAATPRGTRFTEYAVLNQPSANIS